MALRLLLGQQLKSCSLLDSLLYTLPSLRLTNMRRAANVGVRVMERFVTLPLTTEFTHFLAGVPVRWRLYKVQMRTTALKLPKAIAADYYARITGEAMKVAFSAAGVTSAAVARHLRLRL